MSSKAIRLGRMIQFSELYFFHFGIEYSASCWQFNALSQMTTVITITLLDRSKPIIFPTSINKLIIKAASFIKLYGVSK